MKCMPTNCNTISFRFEANLTSVQISLIILLFLRIYRHLFGLLWWNSKSAWRSFLILFIYHRFSMVFLCWLTNCGSFWVWIILWLFHKIRNCKVIVVLNFKAFRFDFYWYRSLCWSNFILFFLHFIESPPNY